jgi:hypothetical protein
MVEDRSIAHRELLFAIETNVEDAGRNRLAGADTIIAAREPVRPRSGKRALTKLQGQQHWG